MKFDIFLSGLPASSAEVFLNRLILKQMSHSQAKELIHLCVVLGKIAVWKVRLDAVAHTKSEKHVLCGYKENGAVPSVYMGLPIYSSNIIFTLTFAR